MTFMPIADSSIDWEVCRRTLSGHSVDRRLTLAEKATVYRAVIAGGGTRNHASGMLRVNGHYLGEVLDYIESTGGINGFPVVDGVMLRWSDHGVKKVNRWH